MARNPESKTVLNSPTDCTLGVRGKVVSGLGYQVSTWCDNMYVKYVRHIYGVLHVSCTERLQASTSSLFFEWTKKLETNEFGKTETTSDNISENLLVFLLTKNREPGVKKGKPRTARDTKTEEPKRAKTGKTGFKKVAKPKLPTPPLVTLK